MGLRFAGTRLTMVPAPIVAELFGRAHSRSRSHINLLAPEKKSAILIKHSLKNVLHERAHFAKDLGLKWFAFCE
jgi:hypothetical protein